MGPSRMRSQTLSTIKYYQASIAFIQSLLIGYAFCIALILINLMLFNMLLPSFEIFKFTFAIMAIKQICFLFFYWYCIRMYNVLFIFIVFVYLFLFFHLNRDMFSMTILFVSNFLYFPMRLK